MERARSPLELVTLRAAREHRPLAALLELTYRCNLKCVYCYNDRGRIRRHLGTGEWVGILGQIAEMGVLHLALSGGEPLLHPGFDEILAEARRLEFAIRVKTSGDLLTRERARRIKALGDPFLVELSLHGADAATHERQTRVQGSFQRLLTNARAAAEEGLRMRLVCTLTRWNEDQLDGMAALAAGLGVPLRLSTEVAPKDDGDRSPLALKVSEGGYRRYRAWVSRQGGLVEDAASRPDPGEVERTCGAAATGFTVDPLGNVLPCVQWRQPAGNLREQRLQDIWEHSPVLRAARRAVELAASRVGPGETACHFCPGLAWILHRNPLTEYRDETHPLGLQEGIAQEET